MMKQVIFLFFFLTACKPAGFIVSPNEVHNDKVVLYLWDKTKVPGNISIDLENTSAVHVEYKPYIEFMPEGKTTWEKMKITDIEGYTLGGDYYAVKNLDVDLNNTHFLLFVKRLTSENSKIQLYELYESGKGNYSGDAGYSYYLSFPGYAPRQTINARSIKLVPYFELKMSNLLDDCPALAKKIRSKEKDYFLPMNTFNRKKTPEVLMKIINEYDSCK
jgi:hypothetical protein